MVPFHRIQNLRTQVYSTDFSSGERRGVFPVNGNISQNILVMKASSWYANYAETRKSDPKNAAKGRNQTT